MIPIRPENIFNDIFDRRFNDTIDRINILIKSYCKYSEAGPFSCFLKRDIDEYDDVLLDQILKLILPLYEQAGWEIHEDIQGNDKQGRPNKYLTFSSTIWKKD